VLSERFKTILVMAQRIIACDCEAVVLDAPDVREWLPDDHFAWLVLEAVHRMELDPSMPSIALAGAAAGV
jgi:hypothetical protein